MSQMKGVERGLEKKKNEFQWWAHVELCIQHELYVTNTYLDQPDKKHASYRILHSLDYIVAQKSNLSDILFIKIMRGMEYSLHGSIASMNETILAKGKKRSTMQRIRS